LQRFGIETQNSAAAGVEERFVFLAELFEKVLYEKRNILAPVAQRRQVYIDDV